MQMDMKRCKLPAVVGYSKQRADKDPAKPSSVLQRNTQHFTYNSGFVALNQDAVLDTAQRILAALQPAPWTQQPATQSASVAIKKLAPPQAAASEQTVTSTHAAAPTRANMPTDNVSHDEVRNGGSVRGFHGS
jgi:hypothetical protein